MKKYTWLLILLIPIVMFSQPTISLTPRITGLNSPLQVAHAGDNTHRIFVVEKGGTIKAYNSNYQFLDTLLRITNIRTASEQGLLSMAFHPNFRQNGYFYVYYTDHGSSTTSGDNKLNVDRYTISGSNPNRANIATKLSILSIPHPATNHNGGKLNFGRDGFLYLSVGDSGGGGDPQNVAQNTNSLLGKMLRINVDSTSGGKNYAIPAGNPFNNEIVSLGLRNPFRWTFDRYTGDMFIGDVGQNAREEVSFVEKSNIPGANFGWRCYEGKVTYNTGGCGNVSQYILPPYDYPTQGSYRSVIGGIVYRGYQYPKLKNWYFFIDYYNSSMHFVNLTNSTWTPSTQITFGSIADFSETEDGEVLICRNVGSPAGVVYQLTTTNPRQVYVFSGSGNWSDSANWKNGLKPENVIPSNADIVIKPYKNGVCTLDVAQVIPPGNGIYIEPETNFVVAQNLNVSSLKSVMRRLRTF
jgi:glucose/arabinose dehydrogenase